MSQDTVISLQEFTALYGKYSARFIEIAMSYLQDRMEAEDVVSESFMTFWDTRETAELPESLPAYILGIVKHKCLDRLRQRQSSQKRTYNIYEQACMDAKVRILQNDSLTQKLFEDEIVTIFERELQNMPPITASVFYASRVEGKTYKEISEALGIPVRTVTREIQNALVAMRRSLKDYLPLAMLVLYNTVEKL